MVMSGRLCAVDPRKWLKCATLLPVGTPELHGSLPLFGSGHLPSGSGVWGNLWRS